MDPYRLAAMEAQAWQDEAARNDAATAAKIRELADEMRALLPRSRPSARVSARLAWSWEDRLREIADGL